MGVWARLVGRRLGVRREGDYRKEKNFCFLCFFGKIFNPSVPKDVLDMFCNLETLWSFFDCW